MSIIYSYPTFGTATGSDLLLASRFDNEPGGPARTINLSLSAIGSYIVSNHANNLNQVLTAGNESLLDAKINSIYLYNDFEPAGIGYTSITGDKNAFNFVNVQGDRYAQISNGQIFVKGVGVPYGVNIKAPVTATQYRNATFQDASGTIAYLSDITSLNLNQVLTNGNESLLNAKIGQLYLWDNLNNQYSTIRITDSAFIIEGIQGITGPLLQIEPGILNLKASGNFTGSLILSGLTDNRNYALPNKSGTIALTSDILTTTNYGLFAQTANSSPVTGTTVESTLINGGVGTLTIPANGFKVGDSFSAVFGGVMNAANNQTIRIRVKAGAITLLDSGVQTLTNSIINDIWSLNIDFTIRQIGGAGVASIVSLGAFHYIKTSNASTQGFAFNVVNNTTFDTTISNVLDVTVQWGSNNVTNNIYSDIFVLNKVY